MKKFLVLVGILLAVGAIGLGVGRPAYRNWKQERLIAQARDSLAKGDMRSAGLSARQAIQINAGNIEACRVMAEIVESFRLPEALQWRQRVVDLEPGSLTNRLEFARYAIQLGEYAQAAKVLQGLDRTNRSSAAFHQMAGMVAVGLKRIGEADGHFTEAVRLEPGNKQMQLNLAVIRLQATNQEVVAAALKSLEQLNSDPTNRVHALRHLAMTASREKDFGQATVFTQELQADPSAKLSDRLMHLTALKEAGNPEFGTYLAGLKTVCATNGESASVLGGWLIGRARVDEAAQWLAGLPDEVQRQTPVILVRAECFMAQKDWAGLQGLLQGGKWEEVDFLRQAILARAYREQRQEFTSQTEWRGAVRAATDRPKQLGMLARTAGQWGWNKEKDEVLWLIVERHPAERWALQSLNQQYLAAGNTRGLHKVYSTLVAYDQNDFAAKNNLAAISLLLNLQTNKAYELAHEAWLKATNNAAFASTYAWSLHLQGRTAEGIKVLEFLPPDRLQIPGVALYYGIMQAAMNQPATAKKYLDLAETAALLPEEKTLLTTSRRGL